MGVQITRVKHPFCLAAPQIISSCQPTSCRLMNELQPPFRRQVLFNEDVLHSVSPLEYRVESGYINVTRSDFFFYLFMSCILSGCSSMQDAPIFLWSQGGPGCTSMEGAFTETGPLELHGILQSDAVYNKIALTRNLFGWNHYGHLLFVDQPRYTGYSYGTGPQASGELETTRDILNFIVQWRALFSEYAGPLVFTGESGAGYLLPEAAKALLDFDNSITRNSANRVQLSGLILGNPCFSFGSIREYVRARVPWIRSREEFNSLNPYDVRLQDRPFHKNCSSRYGGGWDYVPFARWLDRRDVRKVLNTNALGGTSFGGCERGCIEIKNFDYDSYSPVRALSQLLLAGISITLYHGTNSLGCNYLATYEALKKMTWTGREGFLRAPYRKFMLNGIRVGRMKIHSIGKATLTWIEVDQASHMVPRSHPSVGLHILRTHIHHYSPDSLGSFMMSDFKLQDIQLIPFLLMMSVFLLNGRLFGKRAVNAAGNMI